MTLNLIIEKIKSKGEEKREREREREREIFSLGSPRW